MRHIENGERRRLRPSAGGKSGASHPVTAMLAILTYAYLGALLVILAMLWSLGDRWWFATVLLYGPRWIYAIPMIVLVPGTLILRPRLLWPLVLSALIIVWPIMGFNVPWKSLFLKKETRVFRVLTYNIQRWSVSGEEFSRLLDEVDPDFAAVQECAPNRWKIPPKWHVRRARTTVVVSRYPIIRFEISEREPDVNGLYCVVDTPAGPIGFASLDLATPRRALRRVLSAKKVFDLTHIQHAQTHIGRRWQESESLSGWLGEQPERKIFAGDLNLTVDSPIYRTFWADYQNAFSSTELGFGHTKRTKINVFRYTARIDHILSTPAFVPIQCRTGPDLGSDHLPLIADFALR